jgi:DNA polymerase III subunit gamma/tau
VSYLVLARKSRPQTFSEVVGQKPVVRTLQNALAQNRVPHALLFSGVRGTGKTTLARIMAKALNCEQGPAAEPCNACRSCREITDGISLDLQEVDGASNRGIQEIRELKEKIRFMPTNSRFKIIIIDEVHMLTTEAFNALLKTLEEPPSHVYFMFATTEIHKVPITILSRCQRYELKRLGHRELSEHFTRLAGLEQIRMEPEAVEMIVREAGGSVRDGLSLLDQIFSYCGQEVRAEDVIEVLGLVSHELIAGLGTALLRGDLATTYSLLDQMYLHGADIKRFGNDLLIWFRTLVVCKVSKNPGAFLEVTDDELTQLEKIAGTYSLETVSAIFNLLLEGLEKVAVSHQPRLALELAFIRAVQLRDVIPVSELIARFDRLLAGTPIDIVPIAVSPTIAQQQTSAQLEAESIAAAAPESSPQYSSKQYNTPSTKHVKTLPEAVSPALPTHEKPVTAVQHHQPPDVSISPQYGAQPASQDQPPTATTPLTGDSKKRIRQHWDAFLKYVRERQPWVAASLQMAASVERKGETLVIHFADSADCTLLKQQKTTHALAEFVLDFFQENLRIQFEVPGSDACSLDPVNGLAPLQERRALANDPLVLTALDVFTGQVGEIRVGSRYRVSTPAPGASHTEEDQGTTEQ